MLIKKEEKKMEDNIEKEKVIRFISSKDNTTLGDLKESYCFGHRKNKLYVVSCVVTVLISFIMLAMNFIYYSFRSIVFAVFIMIFTIFYDDLIAYIAYRKIKKHNKIISISFEDEHIVVDSGMVRSELKYPMVSCIARSENGVFVVLKKKITCYLKNCEFDNAISVNDFLEFLKSKTGLNVEEKNGGYNNSVAMKIVAAVLTVAIISAQAVFYSTPSFISYGGCTVELCKGYIQTNDDIDQYTAYSSYDNMVVNIYNYKSEEFSDVYECCKLSSPYQIVEEFAQNIQETYDGERLERNGEWLSSLQNGAKVFKMKYYVDDQTEYGVFFIKMNGEKFYFVEFLSEKDFTNKQNQRIDKYISTIQTN